MKPINFLFYFFILFSKLTIAQSGGMDNLPFYASIDMFPKTPDVAALDKFIDIPTGSYTGVMSFSIPIYEIQIEGINIPISIDYATTGIKMNDIASRVGLGWALNAGNTSLSYQVIGSRDSPYGGRPIIIPPFDPDGILTVGSDTEIAVKALGLDSGAGSTDLEPDIYSYTTLNGSGKFLLDSSGNGIGLSFPYNLLKINFNGAVNIIDEKGIKYIFTEFGNILRLNTCDTSISGSAGDPDPNFKITQIIFPSGKKILFNYEKTAYTKYSTSTVQRKLVDTSYSPYPGYIPPPPSPSYCYNYTDSYDHLLTKITFPDGIVNFSYGGDLERLDLVGDYYLKNVNVKDLQGNIVRDFTLKYDYFESTENGQNYPYYEGYGDGIDRRLKLTEAVNNLTNGKYQLNYYEDHQLPPRFSYNTDYWGVYNGKQNTTPIPTTKYHMLFPHTGEKVFMGADRTPDIDYGVIGSLKKIIYPTGGYSEIKYEADEYYDENDSIDYSYIEPDPIYITNFDSPPVIEFEVQGEAVYNSDLLFYQDGEEQDGNTQFGDCKGELQKLVNGQFQQVNGIANTGTYKLIYTDIGSVSPEHPTAPVCYASASWIEEYGELVSKTKKAGTIRVKEIVNKEGNNELIKRRFTYLNPATNYTTTSGKNIGTKLLSAISTELQGKIRDLASPVEDPGIKRLYLMNNPGGELNTIQGKAIGYDYVQEIYQSSLNSSENFKKEYHFSNEYDEVNEEYSPYSVVNLDWPIKHLDRGLMLEEKTFNEEGELVRVIKNDYNKLIDHVNDSSTAQPEGGSIWGFGAKFYLKAGTTNPSIIYTFDYDIFPIKTEWIQSIKTTTTDYINGQPKMVTEQTTAYSPNPPKHTFPIFQTTENSLGEILRTEYQYPQDLPGKPKSGELIAANRIAEPLVVKTFNGSTQLSEQETEYADFSGKILPKFIYAKKGANIAPADKKITYDSYDAQGNLMQYTLADGTPVSIVWGYNGQYPVAKVEGMIYSEIAAQANPLTTNNSLTESSFAGLKELVNAVNKEAMLTCYIYEPLVGIKMIIQPNGQKEVYEYDNAGRLMQVKDHNGKVIKTIDHNYQH